MHIKYQSPPQAPPVFNYTTSSVKRLARSIISAKRHLLDRIASTITQEDATFTNVVEAIARNYDYTSIATRIIHFYPKVASDEELREACRKADDELDDFEIESSMREDIFQLITALHSKRHNLELGSEDLRLIERMHKKGIADGLGVPIGPQRDRFKEIRARLDVIQANYRKNLNEEKSFMWLKRQELSGVSQDVLCTLEEGIGENEDKLRLTFKYPHVRPVLRYATDAETRKRVWLFNQNKCQENVALFKETLVLRDEAARMLGYENHAARKLTGSMAKSPEKVWKFLNDLHAPLLLAAQKELDHLKEIKAQDCLARGVQNDLSFYFWDLLYYERLMLETEHGVDSLQIAEYFPLDNTISAMLKIFASLMDFVFIKLEAADVAKISPTGNANDVIWHQDNLVFSVWDKEIDTAEENAGSFLGYLYMDLHPREGKYGHVSQYNLQPGFTLRDGTRHYPSAALVCNYTMPTAEKPALLNHGEISTLFHELGHAIHNLSSKTLYCKMHGTANPRDFVEAPSQLLEHWCWTPDVLKSMSRHWKTDQEIPDTLIRSLVASKNAGSAMTHLHDFQMAVFDMKCHTPKNHAEVENLDPSSLYQELLTSITLLQGPESNSQSSCWGHGYANHGHLMSGYDASYYGYLYSKVFSTDMFYSVFKTDPMDNEQGRRYRKSVLEYGSSRDELESLTEFLGREPNSQAFYQELGITDSINSADV